MRTLLKPVNFLSSLINTFANYPGMGQFAYGE